LPVCWRREERQERLDIPRSYSSRQLYSHPPVCSTLSRRLWQAPPRHFPGNARRRHKMQQSGGVGMLSSTLTGLPSTSSYASVSADTAVYPSSFGILPEHHGATTNGKTMVPLPVITLLGHGNRAILWARSRPSYSVCSSETISLARLAPLPSFHISGYLSASDPADSATQIRTPIFGDT
jgi:hypothetical protein